MNTEDRKAFIRQFKRPTDFEPTGFRDQMTFDEYWCPSEKHWSMCSGPCPDGQEHGPKRHVVTEGELWVSASTGAREIRNATQRAILHVGE